MMVLFWQLSNKVRLVQLLMAIIYMQPSHRYCHWHPYPAEQGARGLHGWSTLSDQYNSSSYKATHFTVFQATTCILKDFEHRYNKLTITWQTSNKTNLQKTLTWSHTSVRMYTRMFRTWFNIWRNNQYKRVLFLHFLAIPDTLLHHWHPSWLSQSQLQWHSALIHAVVSHLMCTTCSSGYKLAGGDQFPPTLHTLEASWVDVLTLETYHPNYACFLRGTVGLIPMTA